MSSVYMREADFKLFVVLWNQREGRSTPALHMRIADWLEWRWKKKETRLLLMAFRGSGKSTLVGLFAAWLLYRNADLRILVLAADAALAGKMVAQVKKVIERHPLTRHMKPERADQWASDRFTVKRMQKLRDPSMLARGVLSNLTGSRADIVICDDVEVPNTCGTAPKREDLRARLGELSYVLTPGGTQLYVGTPHTYFSIYADEERAGPEGRVFLPEFKRLVIPVFDEKGESAWREKFTRRQIEKLKLQSGPNKFASQMMLNFVNVADGRLDPALLRIYEGGIDYAKELQTLYLNGRKMVSASAWWDPSYGSKHGDRSVLAVVYTDAEGNYYLHHIGYIRPPEDVIDKATWQCRQIVEAAKKFYLPCVTLETNGVGKFLPGILKNEIARTKTPCSVLEASSSAPKDRRILEAFDAPLAAGKIYVHTSVMQTPFATEMQEWRPGSARAPDDGLDAAAGALSQQPVRLPRLYSSGSHSWMQAYNAHKAKTEFEV